MNKKQFDQVSTLIAAQIQTLADRNADEIIRFYNKDSSVKFKVSVLLADETGQCDVSTKLGGQLQKLKDEETGTVDPVEQMQLLDPPRKSKKKKKG